MDVIQKLHTLPSDQLATAMALQQEIQSILRLSMGQTKDKRLANNAIALVCEANEVLNETNWRPWKQPKDVNIDALVEELVDCQLFIFNILNELEFTSSHFLLKIREKQLVNVERYGK